MCNITAIEFNNSPILTTTKNNQVYFGVKSVCENIGIDYEAQYQRIKRDEVLSEVICVIQITYNNDNKDTLFLPLEYLNGFLFGISVERLQNEETKKLLVAYKKECYKVLANHFLRIQTPAQKNKPNTPVRFYLTKEDAENITKTLNEINKIIDKLNTESGLNDYISRSLRYFPELRGSLEDNENFNPVNKAKKLVYEILNLTHKIKVELNNFLIV